MINMKEAILYKKEENNKVKCFLCNHYCNIFENSTGICCARKNIKGKLYSLVYGYPAYMNPDPIEKKPLFHFLPGSLALSLGTYGCNFKCKNCHNWDISQEADILGKNEQLEYIEPKEIIDYALRSGCKSVAYTYNEPCVFTEYALDIMKLARKKKLKNIWVSNGFFSSECLDVISPYLDAINIDLKSMDEDFYKEICRGSLEPILNNLRRISKTKIHLEVTTLIIPGLSDGEEMLERLAGFIVNELGRDVPWHISRFSSQISFALQDLPETNINSINKAYLIGKKAGLNHVYVGNIQSDERENTFCPVCGELVVGRIAYNISRKDVKGKCPKCRTNLNFLIIR